MPPSFEPETVARAVVYAADHPRRREYWVGSSTTATLAPMPPCRGCLTGISRAPASPRSRPPPHDPDAPVNLFEPADGRYGHDFGAHGVFGDRTIGCHPQLWASRHHGMLAAVGVAALSGLVRRLWTRW